MRTHIISVTAEDIILAARSTDFGSPLQFAIRRAFPELLSIRVNSTCVECYNENDEVLLASLPYEAQCFEHKFQIGARVVPFSFAMRDPE